MKRATVIMQQAKQVPDEMLLEMIDAASDDLELKILEAELEARTAPKITLTSIVRQFAH